MTHVKKVSARAGIVLAGVGILVVGGAAGAFAAGIPALLSPAGLSAGPGVQTTPMPKPHYAVNANGQTYGSATDSNSPANEPDLIGVVDTTGHPGYVLKTELAAADGSNIKTPAEALVWDNGGAKQNHTVTVYASDGTTVTGTFIVYGTDSVNTNPQGTYGNK